MSTLLTPPSLSIMPDASAWSREFAADMAEIEMELRARQAADVAEINQHDATHCRQCGLETSGSDPAGCHVQLCDHCIVQWVIEQIGLPLIAECLADAKAA